jgi:hypothetical protein
MVDTLRAIDKGTSSKYFSTASRWVPQLDRCEHQVGERVEGKRVMTGGTGTSQFVVVCDGAPTA